MSLHGRIWAVGTEEALNIGAQLTDAQVRLSDAEAGLIRAESVHREALSDVKDLRARRDGAYRAIVEVGAQNTGLGRSYASHVVGHLLVASGRQLEAQGVQAVVERINDPQRVLTPVLICGPEGDVLRVVSPDRKRPGTYQSLVPRFTSDDANGPVLVGQGWGSEKSINSHLLKPDSENRSFASPDLVIPILSSIFTAEPEEVIEAKQAADEGTYVLSEVGAIYKYLKIQQQLGSQVYINEAEVILRCIETHELSQRSAGTIMETFPQLLAARIFDNGNNWGNGGFERIAHPFVLSFLTSDRLSACIDMTLKGMAKDTARVFPFKGLSSDLKRIRELVNSGTWHEQLRKVVIKQLAKTTGCETDDAGIKSLVEDLDSAALDGVLANAVRNKGLLTIQVGRMSMTPSSLLQRRRGRNLVRFADRLAP